MALETTGWPSRLALIAVHLFATTTLQAGVVSMAAVDPNPRMLIQGTIPPNEEILSMALPASAGLAADGASQLVIQVQVSAPNDIDEAWVEFRLRDGNGRVAADIGHLYQPGLPQFPGTAICVNVEQVDDGRYMAFAVLHAPDDASAINAAVSLTIRVEAEYSNTVGRCVPGDIARLDLVLRHPPVVLLHGFTGDKQSFRFFDYPDGTTGLQQDPRWVSYRAFYHDESVGPIEITALTAIRDELLNPIRQMRRDENVAVTRAWVVAHSMGGVVMRQYIGQPGYARKTGDDINYGRGDVVGLITVATPHLGAYIANVLLDKLEGPTTGSIIKDLAKDVCLTCGALDDLRTDSEFIRHLNGTTYLNGTVPVHAIYGSGGDSFTLSDIIELSVPAIKYLAYALDALKVTSDQIFSARCTNDNLLAAATTIGQLMTPGSVSQLGPITHPINPQFAVHSTLPKEKQTDLLIRELLVGDISGDGCPGCPVWNPAGFPNNTFLPSAAFDQCVPTAPPPLVPPAPPSVGAVRILSPAPGSSVVPGSTIQVTVDVDPGITATSVGVLTSQFTSGNTASGPPWVVDVQVPLYALDTMEVRAVAVAGPTGGLYMATPVTLHIDLTGIDLTGIQVDGPLILTAVVRKRQIVVFGEYSDGIEREWTGASVLGYTVQDPSVLTVDAEGYITPYKLGTTIVTVDLGFLQTDLEIVVAGIPLDLRMTADGLRWPAQAEAFGYDVVVGDLGVLRSSGGDFTLAVTNCLADDLIGTDLRYAEVPDPGTAQFFLVRTSLMPGESRSYDEYENWPTTQQTESRDLEILFAWPTCI